MKKVLKIVAIISMLLLTVFAGGCGKSQEEKYTEARNEFVAMQQQFLALNNALIVFRQLFVFLQRPEPHFRVFFLQKPFQNRMIHCLLSPG